METKLKHKIQANWPQTLNNKYNGPMDTVEMKSTLENIIIVKRAVV